MKQTAKALKIELASYHELQAFSQFGSDLDEVTKRTLKHGDVLMEVLKQGQYSPMSFVDQTIEIFIAQNRYLDDLEIKDIRKFLDDVKAMLYKDHKDIIDEITEKKALSDELISKMKIAIEEIKKVLLV